MKFIYILLLSFFFLITQKNYSQEIYGLINDAKLHPLENVTILLKNATTKSSIKTFSISNKFGEYKLDVLDSLDSFVLEFRSISFKTKTIYIENFVKTKKPYLLDIQLEKEMTKLDEVFIKSSEKPIIKKKDSVIFNLEKFKDGTEKVIEDLIKKLPGMNVDKNGNISFKGKPIKTVLLDGSNLFDNNYTIGTKNINVEMVDELTAIENYIENPILHGIEKTNDVVINLTLKKGKTDFSNNTSLGVGIENKLDLNINSLGISKNIKSFSTISFNNIGKEKSPYNYFSSNSFNLGESNEKINKPTKLIESKKFSSQFSEERERINNNLFTSLNAIYQITKSFGARINIDFKKDNLKRTLISETIFENSLGINDIHEIEKLEKNPEIFNIKLKLDYKLSKKALLEYKTNLINENIITNSKNNINDSIQKSNIKSKDQYISQLINYTNRIGENKAFISSIYYSNYQSPQSLNVFPDYRFNDLNGNKSSNQKVDIENKYFVFSNKLIYNNSKFNLELVAGYTFEKNKLISNLKLIDPILILSENNLDYKSSTPWIKGNLFFNKNKWIFRTNLEVNYLNQNLKNNIEKNKNSKFNKILIKPKLQVTYSLNEISSIYFKANYNEKPINERSMFENIILISSNGALKNSSKLKTLRTYNLEISYNYNDFFNLFQFYGYINYSKNINNFITSYNIDEFVTASNRELLNLSSKSYSLNIGLDKYINLIKSNLRLNSFFSIYNYNNIVNGSDIRSIKSYTGFSNVNLKTGFLGIINFENNFQLNLSSFKDENNSFINNWSFQNSFNIYLKLYKRLNIVTGFDYHLPNTKNKEDFFFIDSSINLSSKNDKFNYSISSKNLTLKKNIYQNVELTDFSKTTTAYNILKPYILFTIDFKF
ncbi:MAG: hypothetical protein DRI95_07800, partial [Bacteroidetes bacterium]